MKNIFYLLIATMISGTTFAQTRMLMNTDGIGINPATATETTKAKLWLNGAGPALPVGSSNANFLNTFRVGLKVISPATNDNTAAVYAESNYENSASPTVNLGDNTGVIGFGSSRAAATGIRGYAYGQTNAFGVKGEAFTITNSSTAYGGHFISTAQGNSNAYGYGVYASTGATAVGNNGIFYGGYFNVGGFGSGNLYGVYSNINSTAPSFYPSYGFGFRSDIVGNFQVAAIGLQATITATGAASSTGARLEVLGSTTGAQYGLFTNVQGSGNVTDRYGVWADVQGYASNQSIGIYSNSVVSSGPALNAYGGTFNASNSNALGAQYGVYATSNAAGAATTKYAGFFAGNVTVTGTFTNPSDERLKKNIQKIQSGAIDKIMALNPSTFQYRTDEFPNVNFSKGTHYGFTAQVVQQVLPALVTENSIDVASHDAKNPSLRTDATQAQTKYMAVNYMEMIPILTKAMQEQQVMIQQLQEEIKALKNK